MTAICVNLSVVPQSLTVSRYAHRELTCRRNYSGGYTDMSVTQQDLETTPIFAALTEEFGLERLFEESPDEEPAAPE